MKFFYIVTSDMIKAGLNGSDLILYAFLNSFKTGFYGSVEYIMQHTNLARRTVYRCLKFLLENNFVIRKSQKVSFPNGYAEERNVYYTQENITDDICACVTDKDIKESEIIEACEKDDKKKKEKEPSEKQQIKTEYLSERERLFQEGKLDTLKCCVNSSLINKRLKVLLEDYQIPASVISRVIRLMATNEFCVVHLDFEFVKLLSEKLFFSFYNRLVSYQRNEIKQPKPTDLKNIKCKRCGGEVNPEGLCYKCDIDKIIERIGMPDV